MAHDGSTVEGWFYYLANHDYAAAPRKKVEGCNTDATRVPIDRCFRSPFVAQSVHDVAEWLREAPRDVHLERIFFAVLDRKAEGSEPSVGLCRIGDKNGKGGEVKCILRKARESSLMLSGFEYGDFDEILMGQGEYKPEV